MRSERTSPRVVVVGGGLAGLCAAIVAEREGAEVVIVEKETRLGGNSAKASSGINALKTGETAGEVGDSVEAFVSDTLASGKGSSDEELVNLLARESSSAVEFLKSFGTTLDTRGRCGGHSFPRTYRNGPPEDGERFQNVGFHIVSKLIAHIEARQGISRITGNKVVELISEADGGGGQRVVGVALEKEAAGGKVLRSSAVVLATGGFGANIMEFVKDSEGYADLPTTNGQFAVGEGLKMAQEAGAMVKGMDHIQVHPTSFVDLKDPQARTTFLAAEALRGCGGVLVNKSGKRFVNELGRRDEVTDAMMKFGNPFPGTKRTFAFLLLNQKAKDCVGPSFGFYEFKGFFQKFESGAAFADTFGIDQHALEDTLMAYSKAAECVGTDDFGKKVFPVDFKFEEALYVAHVTPAIHYTMGGLAFSPGGQVLSGEGKAIRGLYGAGEVTGGLHGANRLGGNSLLECVVFGRIAGASAAHFVDSTSGTCEA